MKDKRFAQGVSREDLVRGAAELGVEFDTHVTFVVEAMAANADLLGLSGTGNQVNSRHQR
jgi:predicted hydrolase (HD superfamily)